MEKIKEFIEKYNIEEYGWYGYGFDEDFMIVIPFNLLSNFMNETGILNLKKNECCDNCTLYNNRIMINLITVFFINEIESVFPRYD